MIDFHLTDEMNPTNAAQVAGHLREPRLWIPTEEDYGSQEHTNWLEKTEAELRECSRHALMATFGRTVAGALIFRVEPQNTETVGIRNISINPDFKGRLVGAFMLRNAEFLMREIYPEATKIIVDTKPTNYDMLGFLESQQYRPDEIIDLYQSGKPDVVLTKSL